MGEFKFGYVGVIGKTNAGKSSLVNKIIGEKVAIVSPKTQTTRQNILGILNGKTSQIVFVDTPGIHKSQNILDKNMMKNVRGAVASSDVLLYVIDPTKKLDTQEIQNILKYASEYTLILAVSKIDLLSKEKIVHFLCELNLPEDNKISAIIPFSSKTGEGIDLLITKILSIIPASSHKNFEFDEEIYTNSSVRFMAGEIIREKALFDLNEEIPHGIAVEITKFDESGDVVKIDADIICEKNSHKGIILGKGGAKIKQIGVEARRDIENLLGQQVMLKIFVKVIENWRQRKNFVV